MTHSDHHLITECRPVETALREETPVLLWIENKDAPPAYPVTVRVRSIDHLDGVRYWSVFTGRFDGSAAYFDEHVSWWMPLPARQSKKG
jgi:hypothetical protein